MVNREQFSGNITVIMAMAGSAIGLGNIWRFPYVMGEHGGAAFILIYLLSCAFIALPIFYAECIIGRRGGSDTFGSMASLAPGSRWPKVGLLTVISPLLILSYYSVVGGWSIHFLISSFSYFDVADGAEVTGHFGKFISSVESPLLSHSLFAALVAAVVLAGVKKGIEKFTKTTMPVLFVLIVAIVVFSLTLPGASKGVEYLVKPDFGKVGMKGVAAAMGQAFFSMSLGVGTVLTYASYMKKKSNLLVTGVGTAISDFLFAILAGFAVIPAVFAAGLSPESGPGIVFETLPYIFVKMGAGMPWLTVVLSAVFFLMVLFAALTSAISMLEVGVAYLVEEKHIRRKRSVFFLTFSVWLVGILCSLSFGPLSGVSLLGFSIFDFLDKLCSNFLLPLGGLLFTLFVGWRMPRAVVLDEFSNGGTRPFNVRVYPILRTLIRYVAPIGIVIIFFSSLLISE